MTDPRFVLLADLHTHPWSSFSKGDGLHNTRLQKSLSILEASLSRAYQDGLPWVFAGDIVHTAGYALNVVLAAIIAILLRYPDVPKIVVWGNHDARGVGGLITVDQTVWASLTQAVPMTILDPSLQNMTMVSNSSLTFSGAGYQPRIDLLQPVAPAIVGIYHQTIASSLAANNFVLEEGLDPEALLKQHRLVISGHIHRPQEIEAPEGQGILIPGSPEQHNFGDSGDRGWWVVTLPEAGNPQLEFIDGGSPKFLTVDTPQEVKVDENFYRVRTMQRGEVLPEGAVAVAPTPTVVSHRDMLRGVAETEQVLQVWLKERPPSTEADITAYLAAGRELLVAQEPTSLRNITLASLRLQDFCCFKDQSLVIKNGVWLITGQGKDYPSNGAGKSTLVGEALYWLLFGRTTKGLGADEVINWGSNSCAVTAVFEDNGTRLIVERSRSPDGHTLLSIIQEDPTQDVMWEATSVNEMTAKLSRYLGITPEIFQNLAYFSQEKLLLFSSATDGERKNVLADLIGLKAYQDASSAAASRCADEEREQIQARTKVEMLEAQIGQATENLADAKECLDRWMHNQTIDIKDAKAAAYKRSEELSASEVRTGRQLTRVNSMLTELVAQRKERLEVQRPGLEARIRENALRAQKGKVQEAEAQHQAYMTLLTQRGLTSLEAAQKAVACIPLHQQTLAEGGEALKELREILQVANTEKTKAMSASLHLRNTASEADRMLEKARETLSVGVCPTCQQAVSGECKDICLAPLVLRAKEAQGYVKQKQAEEKARIEIAGAAGANFAAASTKLKKLSELVTRLTGVAEEVRRVEAAAAEIKHIEDAAVPQQLIDEQVEAQLEAILTKYTAVQKHRLARAQHTGKRREDAQLYLLKEAEARVAQKEGAQNPHAALAEAAESAITTTQQELAIEQQDLVIIQRTITMYDYWRVGFSKQGLQSLLVEEVATRFNANRSNIFPLLTQGIYDVQFSTLSTTRGGELREKTEFVVYEHGAPIPYGALSGGQRRRIDIGIMLVLTQSVAEWMGTQGIFGLLILDEVFGFLDASGAEGLLAALGQITAQVPTIYVITHDTHLQSMVPNVIHIVQDDTGISKVV